MIPTNYSNRSGGSPLKTAILTTVLTLLLHAFSYAQTTCDASAGALNGEICIQNQAVAIRGTLRGDTVVPSGYQILYVLTSGDNLVIEAVSDEASFTIEEMEGIYTIHTLVYDTATLDLDSLVTIGETTGAALNELLVQGGGTICAALDVAGVKFRFGDCGISEDCEADAGSLTAVAGACFSDSTATLTATIADSAIVPEGYNLLYVLTSSDSLVIEQVNEQPTFTIDTIGTYRIHALVYDSTTLRLDSIEIGETTGGDVNALLIQGGGEICGALDVTGALFTVENCDTDSCGADAGSLTAVAGACLDDSTATLTATIADSASVPTGYSLLYVLTAGDSLVIEQVGTTPTFTVDTAGTYRIHALVYDSTTLDLDSIEIGVTTGGTVNSLLTQGGGEICGALDVTGARFDIETCPPPACEAVTGRLTGTPISCLTDGDSITLTATVQTDATIPSGYSLLYVLTAGDSLVIEQVSDGPSFDVDTTGTYRIHVLVYDSTTLDLASIVIGETTGGTVNSLLTQGGGEICGALDVQGVRFTVIDCNDAQDTCAVTFGNLIALNDDVCLGEDEDSVTIEASVQEVPIVLDSFQIAYVLTSSDSLVILDVNDEPSFTVDSVGRYRIHVLVYDSTTLSLDSIVFGTTTGFDVNEMLIQGGGEICAALDAAGVLFDIEVCQDSCEASVGALAIDSSAEEACFSDSTATLKARVATPANVPNGFSLLYVLTSGENLVIEQVNNDPSFTVDTTGRYTIHTLVYDSTTLNLGSIVIGETTGADVNALLIQGGGDICGALDVAGLVFNVESCDSTSVDCDTLELGDLMIVGNDVRCYEGDTVEVELRFSNAPELPTNYEIAYLITQGDDNTVTQLRGEPSFNVDSVGIYRIHVLVYNPETFDLNTITIGTSTASSINESLVQGGGNICAALDTNGIILDVRNCDDEVDCEEDLDTGSLFAEVDGACLNDDYEAVLTAEIDEEAIVPAGYEVAYVLTFGSNLIIADVNDEPTFTVNRVGQYRIHVLVYNPATLDLEEIDLNTTTASEVNELLLQGGGDICAALDLEGLRFDVRDCSCGAYAGELSYTRSGGFTCLRANGVSFLSANTKMRPVIPLGYQRLYVLTSGNSMVIEKVANIPVFGVRETGVYRIHTLIYDPATLDLNSIEFGVTTAAEINALLRQGGGEICAALELPGAKYTVTNCVDPDDDDTEGLVAYPNPATTQVNLNLPQIDNVQRVSIELIDMNGNMTKQWQLDGQSANANLDIHDIQPGMYYIRVLYDQEFVQEMNIIKVR